MHIVSNTKIHTMTEEFKDAFELRHALLLTNVILYVIITFISWDLIWWWEIGTWDPEGRVFFVMPIALVNGFACGAFYDWKNARNKTK